MTTFPTRSNHNSTSRPGDVSPLSSARTSSVSAAGVSHGWKSQHGVPSAGCSPCDSNGNDCPGVCKANPVFCASSGKTFRRNRDEDSIASKESGEPPSKLLQGHSKTFQRGERTCCMHREIKCWDLERRRVDDVLRNFKHFDVFTSHSRRRIAFPFFYQKDILFSISWSLESCSRESVA